MRVLHGIAATAVAIAVLGTNACTNDDSAGAGTGARPKNAGLPSTPLVVKSAVDSTLQARFPKDIRTSGVLRVAADPNYPPSAFKSSSGKIIGVGADFASAITAKTGLRFEWVEVPFDGMLAGLKAHRFDASWSAWTVTRERTEVLNLVTYLEGGTSALVKAGNPKGIEKPLDLCGRTIAAQTGTTQAQGNMDSLQHQCKAAGKPAIKPMIVPQQTNVNQAVATGRADAMLADNTAVAYQGKLQPDLFKSVDSILLSPEPVGVAVPKKDSQLANALAATYNALIADGTYAKILKRWDITNAAITKSQVNRVTS
ncbi:ABC transporter substrate-binding protein [Streptomyces samsunensis]|uniref:ABC transporter substrate-binding protein n=1 Tax=Streptomyces malaysiensis TaxID=92644 RepID=UPI000CA0B65D|nr:MULTISPECIES: ABC transporter substrate-binding protein [Streptomyces]AUA08511.1 Histidine-binding periplasmic protein precursor [Streptomyces sp. M56]MYX60604.1 transporter substrate-binding domain-containing protein [Streptomyces sp. SID8382]NUH38717.1 ABC transporter substrate-binding protein [Streptomyces samsunensis]